MMKKHWLPTTTALALAAMLSACSESQGNEAAAEELPTPEEALRQATEEIDDSNADEEFERLKLELEAEN